MESKSLHRVIVCSNPKCGQEIELFNEDKDGTEITCGHCGQKIKIDKSKEIELEW